MNYQISITQKCNLKCTYCYEKNKNYKDFMDIERIKDVCDFIINDFRSRKKNNQSLGVNITGGEPLLHFEKVQFLITYIEDLAKNNLLPNVHFEISTNATLFNEENLKFLNRNNISLFIGVDGLEESQNLSRKTIKNKGSFDLVCKKIKLLLSMKKIQFENIILNMVVTPENVKYMSKNYKFLLHLSQEREISINPALEENWTKKTIKKYQKELRKVNKEYSKLLVKKNGNYSFLLVDKQANLILANNHKPYTMSACGAGRDSITITTNGEIIPCGGFLYASEESELLTIGSITSPIDEKKISAFRDSINFDLKTCLKCAFLYKCIYYCPANNLKTTGDMNKTSFSICEINKANIIETEFFLNHLYKKNPKLLISKYRNT